MPSWVYLLGGTVLISGLMVGIGGTVLAAVVALAGLSLTTAQLFGLNPVERLRPTSFNWRSGAVSAVVLFAAGAIFDMVLIRNRSDNAYIWIELLAWASYFAGAVFGLSAASGRVLRAVIYCIGLVMLWGVGILAIALFTWALVAIIPTQNYPDSAVFISHLAALLLLFPLLYVVGYYLPHKDWSSPPTTEQPPQPAPTPEEPAV